MVFDFRVDPLKVVKANIYAFKEAVYDYSKVVLEPS